MPRRPRARFINHHQEVQQQARKLRRELVMMTSQCCVATYTTEMILGRGSQRLRTNSGLRAFIFGLG